IGLRDGQSLRRYPGPDQVDIPVPNDVRGLEGLDQDPDALQRIPQPIHRHLDPRYHAVVDQPLQAVLGGVLDRETRLLILLGAPPGLSGSSLPGSNVPFCMPIAGSLSIST